jgi:hypothetical protein
MAYTYHVHLRALWDHAVARYQDGDRNENTFFDASQKAFLDAIGTTPREVYDFAEDFVVSGEPDFETFALVTDRRRSFFLQVQRGIRSERIVMNDELPPKDAAVGGLAWLPRILEKAKIKLRGEMNPDLMYGCGGDRRFLKSIDMHLAEFLALVERHLDDDQAVIDQVLARPRLVEA